MRWFVLCSVLLAGVASAADEWLQEAPASFWQARFHQFTSFRYDLALPAWQKAVAESEDAACQAQCLAGIASTAHLLGKQEIAHQAYKQLLAMKSNPVAVWARLWNQRSFGHDLDVAQPYRYAWQWHDGRRQIQLENGEPVVDRQAHESFEPSSAPGGLTRSSRVDEASHPFRHRIDPGPGQWHVQSLQFPIAVRKVSPRAPWSGTKLAQSWPDERSQARLASTSDEVELRVILRQQDGSERHWDLTFPCGRRQAWLVDIADIDMSITGPVTCEFLFKVPQGVDSGLGRVTYFETRHLPSNKHDGYNHHNGIHFEEDGIGWHVVMDQVLPDQPAVAMTLRRFAGRVGTDDQQTGKVRMHSIAVPPPVEFIIAKQHLFTDSHLEFLKRMQRSDGAWGWEGGPSVEETALALLCFLGAGYEHRSKNRYQQVVRMGLDFLLNHQSSEGLFDEFDYGHALATAAVAEALAMSNDPKLKAPAQRAVDVIVTDLIRDDKKQPLGWSGEQRARIDSAMTMLHIMALRSARAAGHLVIGNSLELIDGWLLPNWNAANTGRAGPRFPTGVDKEAGHIVLDGAGSPEIGLAAAVFLQLRKRDKKHPMLVTMGKAVTGRFSKDMPLDQMYLATLGCFQIGGQAWRSCLDDIRPLLLAGEVEDGHWQGSWHKPDRPFAWYPGRRNRLTNSCFAILTREVFFRYMPIEANDRHTPGNVRQRWPIAPKQQRDPPEKVTSAELKLIVDRNGDLSVNGQKQSQENLLNHLQGVGKVTVFVHARTSYADLVTLIEFLKAQNIEDIDMSVDDSGRRSR